MDTCSHRIITLILIFISLTAHAQIREMKDGSILASVDDRMQECFFVQEKSNWCWAACLQTVLAYYKIHISQRSLVKKTFGNFEDRGATAIEMVQTINGWKKGKRQVTCYADTLINVTDLIGELEQNHPVIVGMPYQGRQHAMVLTRMYFQKDSRIEGKINPTQVVLIDPSRMFLKERKLSFQEFTHLINMALHVRVLKE